VKTCYQFYKKYIDEEVLAVDVQFRPCQGVLWDLNGESATIELHRSQMLY
jgi:hypothetical protein